jgi:hypothetical protein
MVRLNSSLNFISLSGGIVEISHFDFFSLNFQRQPEFGLDNKDLCGRFSWIDLQNSLIWCSFVNRTMGEIILIISVVSDCSDSELLLVKSCSEMIAGDDSVDSCCELRIILNELNDKQLLYFDQFGCGLVW